LEPSRTGGRGAVSGTFGLLLAMPQKDQGCYDAGPVVRPSGRAVYFFDTEGNYQQLHAK
jgi:hypothetical protein